MNYEIKIDKLALKFIRKQPKDQIERLLRAIYALPNGDIKQMKGYVSRYRLRVGDYRIIYSVESNKLYIYVLAVGNRGDVYK